MEDGKLLHIRSDNNIIMIMSKELRQKRTKSTQDHVKLGRFSKKGYASVITCCPFRKDHPLYSSILYLATSGGLINKLYLCSTSCCYYFRSAQRRYNDDDDGAEAQVLTQTKPLSLCEALFM